MQEPSNYSNQNSYQGFIPDVPPPVYSGGVAPAGQVVSSPHLAPVQENQHKTSTENDIPSPIKPQAVSFPPVEVQTLQKNLESASKVLLVFNSNSCNLDQVAMATSFFLAFGKKGIKSSILSLGEPVVAHAALVGINKVVTSLPQEGTIIVLDNKIGQIGNISCDNDDIGGELKIFIRTSSSENQITSSQIKVLPLLAEFDQIIAIGINDLTSLSDMGLIGLTSDRLTVFNDATLCHSQFASNLFQLWGWQIDEDIATNLLMGLDEYSANFSKADLQADIFEIAGWLLRQGGQRYLPAVKQRESDRISFYDQAQYTPTTYKSTHKNDTSSKSTKTTAVVPESNIASTADKKKAFYYKKRGEAQR